MDYQYTIELKNKAFVLFSGDILTLSKNRKSYACTRKGVKQGSIPFDIVNSMRKDLKETCPYPLTFEVI